MKRTRERRRRGRRMTNYDTIRNSSYKERHDLMVLLPNSSNNNNSNTEEESIKLVKLQHLLDRLEFLGYKSIALVYKMTMTTKDCSNNKKNTTTTTTRNSIIPSCEDVFEKSLFGDIIRRHGKRIRIRYRLHVVVETKSDFVALFHNNNSETKEKLDSYDLVSISPQNEEVLRSACCCNENIDIITLDYHSFSNSISSKQKQYFFSLPYKLCIVDHIHAAVQHKIAFELCYGPSIPKTTHNNNSNTSADTNNTNAQRRVMLLRTIRALEAVTLGQKDLNVIVSSGTSNPMELRSPGDICTFFETVGRFSRVKTAQTEAAQTVLRYAWRRRISNKLVVATSSSASTNTTTNNNEDALQRFYGGVQVTQARTGNDVNNDDIPLNRKKKQKTFTINSEDDFIRF